MIKTYEEFINEKLSWPKIALAAVSFYWIGMLYSHLHKTTIEKIIDECDKSVMSDNQIDKIDSIRTLVIERIKNSNKLDVKTQAKIIDSLKNCPFFIVNELPKVKELNPLALFMPSNKLSNKNVIVISKSAYTYSNDELVECIVHEIYHYCDLLLSNNANYLSDINNIQSIFDINITKEEFKKRIFNYAIISNDSMKNKDAIVPVVNDLANLYWKDKDYYLSNTEIFVRLQTMKRFLFDQKQIHNLNDSITLDNLKWLGYIHSKRIKNKIYTDEADFLPLIYFINPNKLNELNKIL